MYAPHGEMQNSRSAPQGVRESESSFQAPIDFPESLAIAEVAQAADWLVKMKEPDVPALDRSPKRLVRVDRRQKKVASPLKIWRHLFEHFVPGRFAKANFQNLSERGVRRAPRGIRVAPSGRR